MKRSLNPPLFPDALPKDDWRLKLHPGDEVTWNDPSSDALPCVGIIAQISVDPGDWAHIVFRDGYDFYCFLDELS